MHSYRWHSSVVVPCYNEQDRLDVRAFGDFATQHRDIELLLVDDGSTDGTAALLEHLRNENATNIRTLHLPRNCGKAEAVRQGMLEALNRRPRFVAYWDADLATPLSAVRQFQEVLERRPNDDAVIGVRLPLLGREINRDARRWFCGKAFRIAAAHVLNLRVSDTQCGAKMFRATEDCRAVFREPFQSRWIFDVEVLARYRRIWRRRDAKRAMLYELPLDQWSEVGESKVKPRDFVRAFVDLALLFRQYRLNGDDAASVNPQPASLGHEKARREQHRRAA